MNNKQHPTPGPWHIETAGGHTAIVGPDDFHVIEVPLDKGQAGEILKANLSFIVNAVNSAYRNSPGLGQGPIDILMKSEHTIRPYPSAESTDEDLRYEDLDPNK